MMATTIISSIRVKPEERFAHDDDLFAMLFLIDGNVEKGLAQILGHATAFVVEGRGIKNAPS